MQVLSVSSRGMKPGGRYPIIAVAKIREFIEPIARGERYSWPLGQILKENKLGDDMGGGSMDLPNGEMEFAWIDLELANDEKAFQLTCETLTKLGAPKGSTLEFKFEGVTRSFPFGSTEGLAIYLDDSELSSASALSSFEKAHDEITKALSVENAGEIRESWDGPTEFGLYLYGGSAKKIYTVIKPIFEKYPLCRNFTDCISVGKSRLPKHRSANSVVQHGEMVTLTCFTYLPPAPASPSSRASFLPPAESVHRTSPSRSPSLRSLRLCPPSRSPLPSWL